MLSQTFPNEILELIFEIYMPSYNASRQEGAKIGLQFKFGVLSHLNKVLHSIDFGSRYFESQMWALGRIMLYDRLYCRGMYMHQIKVIDFRRFDYTRLDLKHLFVKHVGAFALRLDCYLYKDYDGNKLFVDLILSRGSPFQCTEY
jgi:hypothetical protein